MADQLYLSLWFPNFRLVALPAAVAAVLGQAISAAGATGVTAAAAYPISWHETPVYQRIYDEEEVEESTPERAVAQAMEMLHDDFAYEFEARWELWTPEAGDGLDALWKLQPNTLRVVGFGPDFDEGSYEQNGHVRVDFGTDTPFLQDDISMDQEVAGFVARNVAKLVEFTNAVQANVPISSRLLWSESGESLAEKLISRLQRLN